MANDVVYGVPEQKKFPLPDADHVKSAIRFFNYVEPKYEKQLANEILKRAKIYGVDLTKMNIGDSNRFKGYLPVKELKHSAINKDFYNNLPGMVCVMCDHLVKKYGKEDWFPKAWEEYRHHVKTQDMDHMKMPGFVFNKYVKETEMKHSATSDGQYYWIDEDGFYHSGILGMKWGVRRFQNEDGSLTEAGKKRYTNLSGKIEKQQRKIDKFQRKVDKKSRQYLRAEKKKIKAARLKNRAMNAWIMSDSKRARLSFKADRLNAKAAKMQNSTLKNEAKIRRAQSLINKYSRKIAKFAPESTYAGGQFINGLYQVKISDLNK